MRNKPDWFLALSPLGKTPVLRIADTPVFESAVICEYLEETIAGQALHPADALQRARHRAWIEFASDVLNCIWRFYTSKDEDSYRQAADVLRQRFAQVEKELGEGPYFAGQQFGLVDAAFAPVFRYFDLFDVACGEDVFEDTPRVRCWRCVLATRRSVKTVVAPNYGEMLRDFVIRQDGILGRRLRQVA